MTISAAGTSRPAVIPYGDTHPMLPDNRLPLVLVILDGLGDRAVPELGGRTPAEAARDSTP